MEICRLSGGESLVCERENLTRSQFIDYCHSRPKNAAKCIMQSYCYATDTCTGAILGVGSYFYTDIRRLLALTSTVQQSWSFTKYFICRSQAASPADECKKHCVITELTTSQQQLTNSNKPYVPPSVLVVEQSLTSHSTHNRSFRRRVFPANHLAMVLTKQTYNTKINTRNPKIYTRNPKN